MTALCALLALGLTPEVAESRAPYIERACETDQCRAVVAVLWKMETASTFALYPKSRHGCGPGSVLAGVTPTCAEMRVPEAGLRAAFVIYGLKLKRARGNVERGNVERAFRGYSGHPKYRDRYGRKAARLLAKVEARCKH